MLTVRRLITLATLVALLLFLFGSLGEAGSDTALLPQWPQFSYDAACRGLSPYCGPRTNKLKWQFNLPGWGSNVVIGADGTAYFGTSTGILFAVAQDGSEKWRFVLPQAPIQLPPDMPQTEKQEWAQLGLRANLRAVALGPAGTIYCAEEPHHWMHQDENPATPISYERHLYALNQDGTVKWRFSVGDADIITHLTVDKKGTIYFGTAKGPHRQAECRFWAVNPDGTQKWQRLLSSAGSLLSAAIGSDGTLYVGGDKLRAIDPQDGSVRWELDIQTTTSIAAAPAVGPDGTIYVCTPPWAAKDHHKLFAVNPDGTKKWDLMVGAMETSPAIGPDGTIYITSWVTPEVPPQSGIKTGLTAVTPQGQVKWSFETRFPDWHPEPEQRGRPWGSDSSPIVDANSTIYFGTDVGLIYALNADGTLLWKFGRGGEFDNCPALDAAGTLYLCHSGGSGEINRGPLRCYAISDKAMAATATPHRLNLTALQWHHTLGLVGMFVPVGLLCLY